jgi:hypothetical protein
LEYAVMPQLSTKIGCQFKSLEGLYRTHFPGGEVDVRRQGQYEAVYCQGAWQPSPLFELQAGVRWDRFSSHASYQNLAPRLSARFRLSDTQNVKAAFGDFYQYLFQLPRTFFTDIWSSANEYYRNSAARHYIVGYQKAMGRDVELEIEGYYKKYDHLTFLDPFFYIDLKTTHYNEQGEPLFTEPQGFFDVGEGSTAGLELLLRKDRGVVTGWISASLSRTRDTIPGVNQSRSFPPRHDRLIVMNCVGAVDVRNFLRRLKGQAVDPEQNQWNLGWEIVYASGQPLTTTSSVYVANPLPDQDFYRGYNLYPTARNNFRLPSYIRLDWSISYSFQLWGAGMRSFLQVYNITDRHNVWFIRYDDKFKNGAIIQDVQVRPMLPILPSIGIGVTF